MTELMTAAEMRALEAAAIASGAATGRALMERAGAEVVAAVLAARPELTVGAGRRAIVLCGPGANGGDGFVVARLLRARGWRVRALALGAPDARPTDAADAAARWRAVADAPDAPLTPEALSAAAAGAPPALVVDAMFGAGLSRPVAGAAAAVLEALRGPDPFGAPWRPRLAAIDAPSGLCLDSGRVAGAAAPCALTVTFDSPKRGHVLERGPEFCGRLAVRDIGLRRFREGRAPGASLVRRAPLNRESDPARVGAVPRDAFAKPGRAARAGGAAHKYDHGHALVLAGGVGRGGAARLAARAALRVGAGLVTLGAPPAAMIENAARLDAVMLRPIGDAEALRGALGDARVSALCLGPGLGLGAATREMTRAALASGRAVVLDADALTSFAEAPEALFAAIRAAPAPVVVTPHEGEFARLFPQEHAGWRAAPAAWPAASKIDAAQAAAARSGAVTLLKGADTVIAAPPGSGAAPPPRVHAAAYDRAAPWLATAGAGDVLAGMITGLLARGRRAQDAAAHAAWLHAECARAAGPGLIAEDLPERAPDVFAALEGDRG